MPAVAVAAVHQQILAIWLVFLVICAQSVLAGQLSEQLLKKYLSNQELSAWLDEYTNKCSSISRKYSIGKSSSGLDLWVLEVSDKPGVVEPEPNFKYVGNMHGNEPSGRVLLPQLAEWLCSNYKTDARAGKLVEQVHLHILVSMNPDGFAAKQRGNGKGADLNRDFPDPVELQYDAQLMRQPLSRAQPETRAMMDWSLNTHFVASANLHEGAVVANYPYDGYPDQSEALIGVRQPSPDDNTFQYLAKLYARKHSFMSQSKEFTDGITNGAQWYPVYGGMQDWNYIAGKCLAITLELSEDKWRSETHLAALWIENQDALVDFPLVAALGGVRGIVVSSDDDQPLEATISVDGIGWNSSAHQPFGFYSRPLAPGSYTLRVSHVGYITASRRLEVPGDGSGVMAEFRLQREGSPVDSIVIKSDEEENGRLRHRGVVMAVVGLVLCVVGVLATLMVCHGASHRQYQQVNTRVNSV